MRVLSWNLYHGRHFPPDPALRTLRSRLLRMPPLTHEFGDLLDRLEWEVALLQEAPPRWFAELARRTRSSGVRVLTSRNWWPALQGRLADWNPDLLASSEGGSNQILVRSPARVIEHRRLTLALWPERRRMQWVRLDSGICVANLHASAGRARKAAAEVVRAAEAAVDWSGAAPLVFGGDFNLRPARDPEPFAKLRDRFGLGEATAPRAIDHLLGRGLRVAEPSRQLAPEQRELVGADGLRIRLSDHAPVVAEFMR